jgi:hypothetical protein
MLFICERCNYGSKYKAALKKHLTRKKPCKSYSDTPRTCKELLEELYPPKTDDDDQQKFACLCGKKYKDPYSLTRHERTCEPREQAMNVYMFKLYHVVSQVNERYNMNQNDGEYYKMLYNQNTAL